MFNDRIFLTPKEILEKEFKIDARGYRPQEVDKFLDMIIRDYAEYNNIIKKYDVEMKNLVEDNNKLKQELRNIKTDLESREDDGSSKNVSNIDLLRRISQLEKIVFGKNE